MASNGSIGCPIRPLPGLAAVRLMARTSGLLDPTLGQTSREVRYGGRTPTVTGLLSLSRAENF